MDFLFEFLLEFLFEFLLELFGQLFIELGLRTMSEVVRKPFDSHPVLSFFGYVAWGALFGLLSYFPFPNSFIVRPELRVVHLTVSPILVGLTLARIGSARAERDGPVLRIHRFSYGFAMAFMFGIVRWALVH